MPTDRISELKNLHLHGMASALQELLAEASRRPARPELWLDRLIEAEQADRQVRRLSYQLKAARFPIHRDLGGFDWQETPLIRESIEQLAEGTFMDGAHNLILVGGTGTGKTHLAADSTPFGHSAHADPDTCSTIIRTGSRSAATQGWHC